MGTPTALIALAALLAPDANAVEVPTPTQGGTPPTTDAQPDAKQQPSVIAPTAVAPEMAASGNLGRIQTDNVFAQYLTLYQALLLTLAVSPVAAIAIFGLLRRRVIQRLVAEVRQKLGQFDDLETQLNQSSQKADILLANLERHVDEARDDVRSQVEHLTQDIEVQIDDIQEVERIREECLHQLQAAVLEAHRAKSKTIGQISQISPQMILESIKPELRQKIESTAKRLAAVRAVQEQTGVVVPQTTSPAKAENAEDASVPVATAYTPASDSIDYYEAFLETHPEERDAWLKYAELLEKGQRWSEAVVAYERAVSLNDKDAETWLRRGSLLYRTGRYADSVASYDRALEAQSQGNSITEIAPVDAWFGRANALGRLQRYEEAVRSYDRAVQFEPHKYEAWYNRANALNKIQRYDEALQSYDRALEIQPRSHEVWHNRGAMLSRIQRFEEAISAYQTAVSIDGKKFESWYNLGNVLSKIQKYEDALAAYEKAIKIDPARYEVWYNRGAVLVKLQWYKAAVTSYEHVTQLKPTHAEAWYNRGILLDKLQRYDDALTSLDTAIELQPNYYDAWYASGSTLEHLNRYEEALAAYERAIKLKPEQYEAWYSRGQLLSVLNQHQEAMESLGKAFQIQHSMLQASAI